MASSAATKERSAVAAGASAADAALGVSRRRERPTRTPPEDSTHRRRIPAEHRRAEGQGGAARGAAPGRCGRWRRGGSGWPDDALGASGLSARAAGCVRYADPVRGAAARRARAVATLPRPPGAPTSLRASCGATRRRGARPPGHPAPGAGRRARRRRRQPHPRALRAQGAVAGRAALPGGGHDLRHPAGGGSRRRAARQRGSRRTAARPPLARRRTTALRDGHQSWCRRPGCYACVLRGTGLDTAIVVQHRGVARTAAASARSPTSSSRRARPVRLRVSRAPRRTTCARSGPPAGGRPGRAARPQARRPVLAPGALERRRIVSCSVVSPRTSCCAGLPRAGAVASPRLACGSRGPGAGRARGPRRGRSPGGRRPRRRTTGARALGVVVEVAPPALALARPVLLVTAWTA